MKGLHELWMKRCFRLAESGLGYTAPNPLVGAVLVHDGRLIGAGFHRMYGMAHAEVDCLDRVLPADRHLIPESTLYVNLEPCAHFGRTPPCATRIIQEGIRKVCIANDDPFPQVSGKGIRILREAGIEVERQLLLEEGRWLNRRFFTMQEQGRPYVILKWAQSTEGFIAPADKSRLQLSNGFSQRLVHKWRTQEGAIAVGTQTALKDDPRLTSRYWQGPQPFRLFADLHGKVPATHHLMDKSVPTAMISTVSAKVPEGILHVPVSDESQVPAALLSAVCAAGKNSVMIEGGAGFLHSFINAGLWDEARVFCTGVSIRNGLCAPLLQHADPVAEYNVGTDLLRVSLNRGAGFIFPGDSFL